MMILGRPGYLASVASIYGVVWSTQRGAAPSPPLALPPPTPPPPPGTCVDCQTACLTPPELPKGATLCSNLTGKWTGTWTRYRFMQSAELVSSVFLMSLLVYSNHVYSVTESANHHVCFCSDLKEDCWSTATGPRKSDGSVDLTFNRCKPYTTVHKAFNLSAGCDTMEAADGLYTRLLLTSASASSKSDNVPAKTTDSEATVVVSTSLSVSSGLVDGLPSPLGAKARPRFSWALSSSARNVTQASYRLVVSRTRVGAASLADLVCDTGGVFSRRSTLVECGTSSLNASQLYWWSVQVRAADGSQSDWLAAQMFSVGLQSRQDWNPAAKFIGLHESYRNACPWFRTTFNLDANSVTAIKNGSVSALLHVASVGFHEPYFNSIRLENASVLMPSVSDLGRRVLARTYDVQDVVEVGTNAVGLWLAPGWAHLSWPQGDFNITSAPLVMAELRFQWTTRPEDLLRPSVVSNDAWKAHESNIAHNDWSGNKSGWRWANYYGEALTHSSDEPGWATAAFDDTKWTSAIEYPFAQRSVTPESLESVGIVEHVPAVKIEPCQPESSPSDCSLASDLLGGVREECESFVAGCTADDLLNLTCSSGVITSIEFASFGTPNGVCGAFKAGACNSSSSYKHVSDACLGRKSCSIMPNMSNFGGDPCKGQKKRLAVQASGCSPAKPPPAPEPNRTCYVITMEKLFTGWLQVDKFPAPPGANVSLQYSSSDGVAEEWTAHDSVLLSDGADGKSFSNRFNWHEFQFVTVTSSTPFEAPLDPSIITGLRIRNARPRVGWFESSNTMLSKVYDAIVETVEGLQQTGILVDCPNRERFGYGGDSTANCNIYAKSILNCLLKMQRY